MTGIRRCAIYTRKSTEEGLDQAFNSLDAQYEACAAFVVSQRHEGWSLMRERYDDGGWSGGSMARPGLERLLADVAAGKVDIILVYKVDRLTRSLADFAKIVEILDRQGAGFVSVTQSFNTSSAMGRLTLNVLLSFAQFEREVTGERIRDKIGASRARGMWMGGAVPFGYRVEDRQLVIDPLEADSLRHIFERYAALGSGQALIEELRRDGYRTRIRRHRERIIGGIPFSRGMLFHMLNNRVYRGDVIHKGMVHPGAHEAIIPSDLWEAVQARLEQNRVERESGINIRAPSLLLGVLRDEHGRSMTSSHTVKGKKRYRYYVTRADAMCEDGPPAGRIPAHDVETAVISRICRLFEDRKAISGLVLESMSDDAQVSVVLRRAAALVELLSSHHRRRSLVRAIVSSVTLEASRLVIAIDRGALFRQLGIDPPPDSEAAPLILLETSAVKVGKGKVTKLVLGDAASPAADPALVALLAEAANVRDAVLADTDLTLHALARESGRCRKRLTRLMRLSWLAPDIAAAIAEGRQPETLTPDRLLSVRLPLVWDAQRTVLGFA